MLRPRVSRRGIDRNAGLQGCRHTRNKSEYDGVEAGIQLRVLMQIGCAVFELLLIIIEVCSCFRGLTHYRRHTRIYSEYPQRPCQPTVPQPSGQL